MFSVCTPTLLQSIMYSQYLRVQRNCFLEDGFRRQSDKIHMRLLEQGYSKSTLCKAFNRLKGKSRQAILFTTRPKNTADPVVQFITNYTSQHQDIRCILTKHWGLLMTDEKVGQYVTLYPQITNRRACSIRDSFVISHFVEVGLADPCRWIGTYTCGGCAYCRNINVGTKVTLFDGTVYTSKHFVNFKTIRVVYCHRGMLLSGEDEESFLNENQGSSIRYL